MGTLTIGSETYQVSIIGTREWMVENLRDTSTGGVWYDSNQATYAWAGAMCTPPQARALTPPTGWRLPNFDDFFDIMTALMAPAQGDWCDAHRRIASAEHWIAGSVLATTATNASGFSFGGTGCSGGMVSGETDEIWSMDTGYIGYMYVKPSDSSDELSVLAIDRDTPQPINSFGLSSVSEPIDGNPYSRRYYPIRYVRDADVQVIQNPVISPNEERHDSAFLATITCETVGASIKYTLDGTTPTASSPLYSTPIQITSSCSIKAIAMLSGYQDSSVVEKNYIIATHKSVVSLVSFSFGIGV